MERSYAHSDTRAADPYDRYLAEIQHFTPLTREQEGEAARAARAGDQAALDRLVRANLRFVVRVALKYSNRGVPLLDLIAEGNLGLVEAAQRFDEGRGCKFITYAVWWIRHRIHQALRRGSRVVPLSWKQMEDGKRAQRESRSLAQELGREVSLNEALHAAEVGPEAAPPAEVSLDAPLFEGASISLSDTLAEPTLETDRLLEEQALGEAIRHGLEYLEPREASVIRGYFGLDGQEPATLEQIGEGMGVSRERVRQIRNRGLQKLRRTCGDTLAELSMN